MAFEVEIIRGLQSIRNDFFDAFFNLFSYLGSVWAVAVVALLIFFLYNKKVGVAFAITEGVAYLSCWLMKNLIKRPRPFVAVENILDIGGESGFSFPSGHLTATIVIAIFLFYIAFHIFKKRGKIISSVCIVLYVLLMVVDRMYLGVHYITDTIGGIVLGSIWCAVALLALPPLGRLFDKHYAKIRAKIVAKREAKKEAKQEADEELKQDKMPESEGEMPVEHSDKEGE